MAWIKNKASEITWGDNAKSGDIGGFGRGTSDADQTFVGPVYSPNGTAHWLVVSDAGAVTAVTTKP